MKEDDLQAEVVQQVVLIDEANARNGSIDAFDKDNPVQLSNAFYLILAFIVVVVLLLTYFIFLMIKRHCLTSGGGWRFATGEHTGFGNQPNSARIHRRPRRNNAALQQERESSAESIRSRKRYATRLDYCSTAQ